MSSENATAANDKSGKNARMTVTVEEAAELLGIGRAAAYEAVRAGLIPSIRINRRILISRARLEELLSGAAR